MKSCEIDGSGQTCRACADDEAVERFAGCFSGIEIYDRLSECQVFASKHFALPGDTSGTSREAIPIHAAPDWSTVGKSLFDLS